MCMWAVLLIGFCDPDDTVLRDRVDVIEINCYYDHDSNQVFQQLIYWEWVSEEHAHRVCAWRMAKNRHYLPVYNHWTGYWEATFMDQGCLRKIRARSLRRTWTQYDPELLDRQHRTPEQRRGLARPGKMKGKD